MKHPIKKMTVLGQPLQACRIVIPDDPADSFTQCLHVFTEALESATGVHIQPVAAHAWTADDTAPAFLLGQTGLETERIKHIRTRLGKEGYALVADEGKVFVTGSGQHERGDIYALYAFLKRIGWRFPSADYKVCHPSDEVIIDGTLCEVSRPWFLARDVFWHDNMTNGRQANALGVNGTVRRTYTGFGGGVTYGKKYWVHTILSLAEMENRGPGTQPCLTDEGVYQTVLKNVRGILKDEPDCDIISVSQNDSYADQLGCQCERCRAIDEREGTPMGSLLTFVNRIARDIRDEYPHVLIDTLAYRYTRKAPKTVRPESNVVIRLCTIECCFSHPISDPTCPQNVDFCNDLRAWSAICDKLYIWDYTTDFLYYIGPFPDFGVLYENIRFFKENHAIGVFEQGNSQSVSGEMAEVRAALLSAALWNPDMTADAYSSLTNEILCDYYGAGWRHIRTYMDIITRNAATRHLHIYDDVTAVIPMIDEAGQPDPTLPDHLLSLWDAAYAEAEAPEQQAHVARSRLSVRFMVAAIRYDAGIPTDCTDLLADIRQAGITQLREKVPMRACIDPMADPRSFCSSKG